MCLHVFQLVVHTDDGREVTLDWDRVRSFEKEIATMFMLQVKEFKEAVWVHYTRLNCQGLKNNKLLLIPMGKISEVFLPYTLFWESPNISGLQFGCTINFWSRNKVVLTSLSFRGVTVEWVTYGKVMQEQQGRRWRYKRGKEKKERNDCVCCFWGISTNAFLIKSL